VPLYTTEPKSRSSTMSYQEIQIEMATMFVEFDLPIPMHLYTSLLSQGIDVGALVQLYQH